MRATLRQVWLPILWLGCQSNYAAVCGDLGACESQVQAQIDSCESSAQALSAEAYDAGCAAPFDDYFDCASSAYQCNGDTVTFPGCDSNLSSLDSCLDEERAHTSCGLLAAALATCPSTDAGAAPPSPCGAPEACAASCYLNSVASPCAPTPAELTAVNSCVASCP